MNRQTWRPLSVLIAVAVLTATGFAQSAPGPGEGEIFEHVLIVDETQTFASTMRVGALAGFLRQGGADLEVRFETVPTSYVNPLEGLAEPEEPFDLILIIPIGVDDGSVPEIWLLRPSALAQSDAVLAQIDPLCALLSAVFEGVAHPVDILDDLWVAVHAALYEIQGWLR